VKIILKELYLTNITYFQMMVRPSCDVDDASIGFKQILIAVDSYAAANPSSPWMTFQSCAVICVDTY